MEYQWTVFVLAVVRIRGYDRFDLASIGAFFPMSESPQSQGGMARAARLTADRRSEIAKQGAEARWIRDSAVAQLPRAICGGSDRPLRIGSVEIPCYVLADGTRVLAQRGLQSGVGLSEGGGKRGARKMAALMEALAQKGINIRGLVARANSPIRFVPPHGGNPADGYEATILPDVCAVIIDADQQGKLGARLKHLAERAAILQHGFATVGIVALVDEATGYERIRARDELQRILSAYIAEELLPWAKQFPDSFYEHVYRVRGWKYKIGSHKRTAYVGKLTNWLIYEQLPPGVLQELKRRNPVDPKTKRRKRAHHQHLTEDVGHPHLQQQITAVTTLLRASPDGRWQFFRALFNNAFPPKQRDLFDELELELEIADEMNDYA